MATEDEQAEDVIEVDEWLLSFCIVQKDIEKHPQKDVRLERNWLGKCVKLEKAVGSPEAKILLAAAADKFQEAATAAMFNWGAFAVRLKSSGGSLKRKRREVEKQKRRKQNEDELPTLARLARTRCRV